MQAISYRWSGLTGVGEVGSSLFILGAAPHQVQPNQSDAASSAAAPSRSSPVTPRAVRPDGRRNHRPGAPKQLAQPSKTRFTHSTGPTESRVGGCATLVAGGAGGRGGAAG